MIVVRDILKKFQKLAERDDLVDEKKKLNSLVTI